MFNISRADVLVSEPSHYQLDMAPVYVKGGAWTNVEDEILKAAVAKYGLTQWARVSSLLAKKTAKQCKARWEEWLNPRVNHLEWSRDEDAKLLRLARLMPNQWRSISNITGRTATQCVERYQKLLEEAGGVSSDLRHMELGLSGPGIESNAPVGAEFKLGDINLNPENKPAMLDTVDMDEEELEMLSEARARLANTQGKKAKRKVREKFLEESRYIAELQKRRELKQAGIGGTKKRKKQDNQVDYLSDVPFERAPYQGTYDVDDENLANLKEMEDYQLRANKYGIQDQDAQKQKRKRKREKEDEKKKDQMAQIVVFEELYPTKKKKLDLPEPGSVVGDEITDDAIIQATQQLIRRSQKQSFIGSTADELESESTNGKLDNVRPAPVSAKKERKRLVALIRTKFSQLPKPKNNFQITLPHESQAFVTGNENEIRDQYIDLGEAERRIKLHEEEEYFKSLSRRSQTIQRGLPLPSPTAIPSTNNLLQDLVDQEIMKMIESDYNQVNDVPGFRITQLTEEEKQQADLEIFEEITKNQDSFLKFQDHLRNLDLFKSFEYTKSFRNLRSQYLKTRIDDISKLESTINLQNEDIIDKHNQLIQSLEELQTLSIKLDMEYNVFGHFRENERMVIQVRTEALQDEADEAKKIQRKAELRYNNLLENLNH